MYLILAFGTFSKQAMSNMRPKWIEQEKIVIARLIERERERDRVSAIVR